MVQPVSACQRLLILLLPLCATACRGPRPPAAAPGPAADERQALHKEAAGIRDRALAYLVKHQNEDGSFGAANDKAPPIAVTALVQYVLASTASSASTRPQALAVTYLLGAQNPDGSFGQGADRIFDTLLAIKALLASSHAQANRCVRRARQFLRDQPAYFPVLGADTLEADAASLRLAWDKAHHPVGPLATLLLEQAFPGAIRKRYDWLKPVLASLGEHVVPAESGEPSGALRPSSDPFERDPLVATALGARVADLIALEAVDAKRLEPRCPVRRPPQP